MYSCISSLSLLYHHLVALETLLKLVFIGFPVFAPTYVLFFMNMRSSFFLSSDQTVPVLLRVFLSYQLLSTGCPTYNICLFYTGSVKVF